MALLMLKKYTSLIRLVERSKREIERERNRERERKRKREAVKEREREGEKGRRDR